MLLINNLQLFFTWLIKLGKFVEYEAKNNF